MALALLAIPTFTGVIRKSKDATAEATLSALGRDVAALAALNGGTITTSDVKTAVSELPSFAAAPGRFASGTAYSVTSGTSDGPGQIAYDIASGGSKVGLAEVAPSGDVVYALASSSGVQTWVGCSAATGAEALGGPSGTSACSSSGGSSSAQGSGGATSVGSTTTTTLPANETTASSGLEGYALTGVTASASSTYGGCTNGCPASAAFDDNISTGWNAGAYSGTLTGTWSGTVPISTVYLALHATPAGGWPITIYGTTDQGANWTQIGTGDPSVGTGVTEYPISVTAGDYNGLRVVFGSTSWIAVYEVTVR